MAGDTKGTLGTTIQLRKDAAEVKEAVEDNTDKRLSALTLGLLSPQQVETIRPLLMPVTLSFVAGLLITLALDHDLPMATPKERKPWRWSWSKRKEPASTEPEPEESGAPSTPQLIEVPAPLRVASDTNLKHFMLACLLRAIGDETPGTAIYLRFQRWCSEQTPPLAAPDAWTFARQFKAVCDRAGIRMRKDGTQVLCLDVRLAA